MRPRSATPDPPRPRRQMRIASAMIAVAVAAIVCGAARSIAAGEFASVLVFLALSTALGLLIASAVLAVAGIGITLGWFGFLLVAGAARAGRGLRRVVDRIS